jgi:hypothetical protein
MEINKEIAFVLRYFMMQTYFHEHNSSVKDYPAQNNLGDQNGIDKESERYKLLSKVLNVISVKQSKSGFKVIK